MPYEFADIKARARRIVHKTFSIDAEYFMEDDDVPTPLRVRWHNKMTAVGDLNGDGYPLTLETIDRVIFRAEELAENAVQIERGGRLKIKAEIYGGAVLVIDSLEPARGASDEEIWRVNLLDHGRKHP